MIIEAVRLLVTLSITAIGFQIGRSWPEWFPAWTVNPEIAIVWGAVIGAGVGYVIGGPAGRTVARGLDQAPAALSRASGPALFAGAFGLVTGIIVGVVGALPLVLALPPSAGWPIGGLIVLVLAAFGARMFAARADEMARLAGLPLDASVRTRVDGVGYIVDSSAAIDGRILDLARAGLLGGVVAVPAFVINELQAIADSGDSTRRMRGRRGLEVLELLRNHGGVEFTVIEDVVTDHIDVDAKLLAVAARSGAILITTDHNLASAAALRDLPVLNPHSLGESLRPRIESGEAIRVTIEKEGSEEGQGVGYLEDGTMVVVAGASDAVGQTVEAEISNLLRTSVGRMAFARMSEAEGQS